MFEINVQYTQIIFVFNSKWFCKNVERRNLPIFAIFARENKNDINEREKC